MDKTLTEELLGLAKRIVVATKRIEDATKQIADGLEGAQPRPVGVIARPGDTIVLRRGCLNSAGAGRKFTVSTWAAFRRSFPTSAGCCTGGEHSLYYSIPDDSRTYYAPLTDCETLSGEPITGYEDD